MASQGSILTLAITANTGYFDTADGAVQAVSSDLTQDGRLSVVGSPQIGGSFLNSLLGVAESLNTNQPFQVTIQVLCNTSFANQNDPLSIVEGFFNQETSFYPTAGSVTAIQAPGATAAVATGMPGNSATGIGGSSASASGSALVGTSISDAISKFFADLTSTAKTLLIALIGIIVLVLVLVAFGPNVKSVATAVA